MVTFDFTQAYPSMAAFLFIFTGGLMLWADKNTYRAKHFIRENLWATRLGWMNITFGVLLFVARTVYLQWIW